MFATVLREIKSPQNVGLIIRSHVAFGGGPLIFLGYEKPWEFKKGTQAFSRKLETECEVINIKGDKEFFTWCLQNDWIPIAIEISTPLQVTYDFQFPEKTALIVGSEGSGLPTDFLKQCHHTLTIPQVGPVGCLNVGVSCSIAMYEHNKKVDFIREINDDKFVVNE